MSFIYKPNFGNLADKGLQYKDVITYIGIRSFYNEKDKFCFPSYRTLVKRIGCSIKFLRESIERLQTSGYLQILKVSSMRPRHYYKFEDVGTFTRIPFEMLTDDELKIGEKATLAVLQEYCSSGVSYTKLEDVAIQAGLSFRTLTSNFQTLLLKGYVVEYFFEDLLNSTVVKTFRLTTKLKWNSTTKSCYKHEGEEDDPLHIVMKIIKTLPRR